MNEKLHNFGYLYSRSMDYSIEQLEKSINRLKSLKNGKEKSNLVDDSTLEQAITDVEGHLSRVLTLLNKIKGSDGNLSEWDRLLKTYDDA